jgi:hypothetical protein
MRQGVYKRDAVAHRKAVEHDPKDRADKPQQTIRRVSPKHERQRAIPNRRDQQRRRQQRARDPHHVLLKTPNMRPERDVGRVRQRHKPLNRLDIRMAQEARGECREQRGKQPADEPAKKTINR